MKSEILPIGTVVMLEGGSKPLMITGYKMSDGKKPEDPKEEVKYYDYVGCVFPEGLMEETFSLFDNSQIENVMFVGYSEDDFKEHVNNMENLSFSSGRGLVDNGHHKREFVKTASRKPKAPTNPRSKSEMLKEFGVTQMSGTEGLSDDLLGGGE